MPSYILRNYKLQWKTTEGLKEIILPNLNPGEKYTVVIDKLDCTVKPTLKVYRPTGYLVLEY